MTRQMGSIDQTRMNSCGGDIRVFFGELGRIEDVGEFALGITYEFACPS